MAKKQIKRNKRVRSQAKSKIKSNKKITSKEDMLVLEQIFRNATSSRRLALERLLNPNKDINYECGYPSTIDLIDYKAMYDREGVGTRVVKLFPDESWAMLPKIEENQEVKETTFENEWKLLEKEKHLFHYLHRVDVLSGIGHYGVLLLGISDGKQLWSPVKGINPVTGVKTGNAQHKLLYLRAFDESVIAVKTKEADITSPRYGLPKTYTIDFTSSVSGVSGGASLSSKSVHWTRVLHIADNREVSEINGVPRMKSVYNRLLDLRKIVAGSGEMFWKGGFPGIAMKLGEGTSLTTADKTALKTQIKDYQDGLQRWLALENIEVQELKPQIADPTGHIKAQLLYICSTLGIPYRIFMGSEAAHLASTEDKDTWNTRIKRRQEEYVSPMLIRLLVDRLIAFGTLPQVEYFVEWPDLSAPGEKEVAEIAVRRTEALAKYVAGGVDELIPPKEFLTMILGMTEEDAEVVIKAAEKYIPPDLDDDLDNEPIKPEEELEENAEDIKRLNLLATIKDFEYLLHHIDIDDDGEEEIHHCLLYDHIANMFEQGHLVIKGNKVYLDGREIGDRVFHVLKSLEPSQETVWSDVEASENGIKAKKMIAGMTTKQKSKEW